MNKVPPSGQDMGFIACEYQTEFDDEVRLIASKALDLMLMFTEASRGIIFVCDANGFLPLVNHGFHASDSQHKKSEIDAELYQHITNLVKNVFLSGLPFVRSNHFHLDKGGINELCKDDLEGMDLGSHCILPLSFKNKGIGVVYIDSTLKNTITSEVELNFIQDMVNLVSICIQSLSKAKDKDYDLRSVKQLLERHEHDLEIQKYSFKNFVGISEKKNELFQILHRTLDSNATIMLTGESGVGKEMIAKMIHYNSPRKYAPFVAINCGAIPENLLESELFGFMKGAFTGANEDKKGLFLEANHGTLFLDEIGDLPLGMQVKILRALQEKEVFPIGGSEAQKFEVGLICSTNKNLVKMVKDDSFREDLYYRLSVVNVRVPTVRERKKDIPLLVDHALRTYAIENNVPQKNISEHAMGFLVNYPWPGNVREIINVMYNLSIFVDGPMIEFSDIMEQKNLLRKDLEPREGISPDDELNKLSLKIDAHDLSLSDAKHEFERLQIQRALALCNGRITGASHYLQMPRPQVSRLVKKYGLKETGD